MSQEEMIKSIIQEILDLNMEEIQLNSNLTNDLGADELQIADIVQEIENKLSIKLKCESFDITVNDLVVMSKAANIQEISKLLDKPRKLHYLFAHQLIRDLIFRDGINLFADLRVKRGHDYMPGSQMIAGLDSNGNPISDGLDYILHFWNQLSIKLKSEFISTDKLDYEIIFEADTLILFFIFPEPLAVGEAYCSLFLWNDQMPMGRDYSEVVENSAHYYTLELSFDNKSVIGQWKKDGTHINLGSFESILTPRQFLDEVLAKDKENQTSLGTKTNKEDEPNPISPRQVEYGKIDDDHIYSRIILSFANHLQIAVSELNNNTSVQNLKKEDYVEIMCDVYKMYEIDPQKHISVLMYDVERFIKNKSEDWFNCGFVVIKICNHFENLVIGDYLDPKPIYADYRAKLSLILHSPDFSILHDFISKTNPSLLGEVVNQEILNRKELLFESVLTIPERFLLHNYPIDPRGLFVCLLSTSIAHYKYTKSEEKAATLLESANELNMKWGPFIESSIIDKIKNQSVEQTPIEETKTGCFIATAVYGTPLADEVVLLKKFRDNWLMNFSLGKLFIKLYYKISPSIANKITHHQFLKVITKSILIKPLLKIVKQINIEEK